MSVLAIAHRAGNSLEGLQAANALGVDVIECDLYEYRGRLEVRHLKTAGPLPFLWERWHLVPASAPRLGLDQLLEADRHGATFMLDLKNRGASSAASVVELLHRVLPDRPVLACGRHWPLVDAVASLPFVRPVITLRTRLELNPLRRRLASGPRLAGVSVHLPLVTKDLVSELHESVDTVMTWPINTLDSLDHVLAMGVSGIISDEREVLAEVIARRD